MGLALKVSTPLAEDAVESQRQAVVPTQPSAAQARVYFFHWWPLKEMGSAATPEDVAVPGLVLLGLWASGVHHQHHHHTQGVDALICLFTFDRIGSSSLRAGFL